MRYVLLFIEVATIILVGYFIVTQLMMPALRGTKLFPFFRAEESALREKILAERQRLREGRFKTLLQRLRRTKKE